MAISRNKIDISYLIKSQYFYGQLLSNLIDTMLAHTHGEKIWSGSNSAEADSSSKV